MSLFDKLKGELIDIIEWLDDSSDVMVWRFPRYNNEIKYGAKLIVRDSQLAVFVQHGKIADVFKPGTHELTSRNLPVLSTLLGWYHGFESPFKSEVYFINTKNFTNLKWGTSNPVIMKTDDFGAVRLKSYGTYVLKVGDPKKFLTEIVGTNKEFTVDGISDQLRNIVVSRFSDLLAEKKIDVLALATQYDELAKMMEEKLKEEFMEYGLEITKFVIENISLPKDVEEILDKKTSMNIVDDMNKFSQFQSAVSMEKAADNPSGEASGGIGMGMGFAMANQMTSEMINQTSSIQNSQQKATPPPLNSDVAELYLSDGKKKFGPYTQKQIEGFIKDNKVKGEHLYWEPGMENWTKLKNVTKLSKLFKDVPPPLN